MSKSTIILVAILLGIHSAAAQLPTTPQVYGEFCLTQMGNYTTNSTYEANVLTVLADLYAQSSTAYFSNASAGSPASGNQVFGQYYCRGDVSASFCSDCIKAAATTAFVDCYNIKAAVVWYRECTIRYQNISVVGMELERPGVRGNNTDNAADQLTFGAVVNKTMSRLINESAFGGNSLLFAAGEGEVSQFETVYCLVQCSPDLSSTQCDTCLHAAYDVIPNRWATRASVYLPSCQLRYSTVAFYTLPNTPPPPATTVPSGTATSPPPSPAIKSATPRTGDSAVPGNNFNIGLVISAVVFTLLRFQ